MSEVSDNPAPAPKRRWFRFSPGTLFVAITVLCVWLGYHVNWIQQRRALLNRRNVAVSFAPARRPPSFGFWLLGERGATGVFLQYDGWVGVEWSEADEAQKILASQLYPEAKIETWGGTNTQPARTNHSRLRRATPLALAQVASARTCNSCLGRRFGPGLMLV